jgi:hypothetical protein
MDYKQAKGIRKSSLGSLLAEQEGGLSSSLMKALSLKTKANITGIKETFDPLSIAKFLTMGSDWAPAMLGKMAGRSKKDIGYFSGSKNAHQMSGGDTATKVGSLKSSTEMLDILMKIYSFMQKTNDEEKKRREEENNYKEIKDDDKKKRHDALLAAINGVGSQKEQKTVEKIQNDTGMGIGGIVGSLLESFGGAASGLNLLKSVGSFFMNPVTGGILLGAASLAAIFYAMSQASPEAHAEAAKVAGATDSSTEGAAIMDVVANTSNVERRKQNILADRPSSKKSMLFWKDPELQNKYLEEIGFDEKTGLTEAEKKQGYTGLDENGLPAKKQTAKSVASTSATPQAQDSVTASTPPPVETPNAGQKLNAVQAQNNDLNIPESKPDPSSLISNTVNSSQGKGQNKFPIPSVRNSEQTFQRMILNSTRVV